MEERVRPMYYRVAEDLKEKIMTGGFSPGQMIPSESQIAELYGVSRATARQGVGMLVEGGYVYPVQGKGYYVAAPALDKIIFDTSGESIFGQKMQADLIRIDTVPASDILADRLGVKCGETILRMERILISPEGPLAIDQRYLPYRKRKPLVEKELQYADFPDLVALHSDVVLARSNFTVTAVCLSCEEASLLKAETSIPALCLEQVLYDITDNPMGWSRTVCRGDRYAMSGVSYPYSGRR